MESAKSAITKPPHDLERSEKGGLVKLYTGIIPDIFIVTESGNFIDLVCNF
ncbi:MAG: hypothetical protein IKF09_10315 [Clostridiales bacterium]|nr:hypothetical protein [Clostridiales bacterium]